MAEFYARNLGFLQPFSPTFDVGMTSVARWEDRLAAGREELDRGRAVRLALLLPDGPVAGIANFTGIARFPIYACTLGYALGEEHQGKGLMEEGLRAAVSLMFGEFGLHRIAANYMPRNERSARLLRKLGFQVEGYARAFLLIDGRWEDHVLTSLRNEEWRP
jgi:ribosomal-protein-alanine N-acetyltransferase